MAWERPMNVGAALWAHPAKICGQSITSQCAQTRERRCVLQGQKSNRVRLAVSFGRVWWQKQAADRSVTQKARQSTEAEPGVYCWG